MPEPPSHEAWTERGSAELLRPVRSSEPCAGEAASPDGSPAAPDGATPERGRHGRAPAPESVADAALRRRAVRLAVLPAAFVAVLAASVGYLLAPGGGHLWPFPADTGPLLPWCLLAAALLPACAVIAGAAHCASSDARATAERYRALRRATSRSRTELGALLQGLEQGATPRPRVRSPLQPPAAGADALELLTYELALTHRTAEDSLVEAAALVRDTAGGSEEKVGVFVNLARRLQSLVHREIEQLDELENQVEDPDLLKGLFHIDHLATRIRRHAENLAVLGGAVSRRQWSRPVASTEVLRSAVAEVEQYSRVKLVPPIEGTLRGHAVADVVHLLAELIENATVFSAPQTHVLLRAQHVASGLAVEVEDRGLGMTADEQNRMNAVLSDADRIDAGALLQDGRIGLFVVSALARRHGIVVQLQNNIYGGIQAVLVLPRELLGEEPAAEDAARTAEPLPGPSAVEPERSPAPLGPAVPTSAADAGDPGPDERQHPAELPRQAPRSAVPPQVRRESLHGGTPDERPRLPKRRRQQHLAPELRDTVLASSAPWEDTDRGHDPGLMASFQRGTSLADDCEADGFPAPGPVPDGAPADGVTPPVRPGDVLPPDR